MQMTHTQSRELLAGVIKGYAAAAYEQGLINLKETQGLIEAVDFCIDTYDYDGLVDLSRKVQNIVLRHMDFLSQL